MFFKKKIVVTHNGGFHTDDVFAVATLSLLYRGKIKVIRSREKKEWDKADFVVDVGGIYDPKTQRFDHHQEGGAGTRVSGVSYASFGLVWKEFGTALCGSEKIAHAIDEQLVSFIDTMDNGVGDVRPVTGNVFPYDIRSLIFAWNPTWKEEGMHDIYFEEAVLFASSVLQRLIRAKRDAEEGESMVVKSYEASQDKRVLVLEQSLPWKECAYLFPELLFVVEPRSESNQWALKAVRQNDAVFVNKKDLPLEWAGKTGDDFARVSGVSDALFCHNKRFIATTQSKEGAMKLVEKALVA